MYLSYRDKEENIQVHFLYSPYHELIGSLHVLCNAKHHISREEWAYTMLDRLSMEMKDELERFKGALNGFIDALGFLENRELWDMSITESIAFIEQLHAETFIMQLFFENAISKESILNAIRNQYFHESIPSRCIEPLRDPKGFQKAFVNFLRIYYTMYFVNDISFSEPLLVRKLKREYERCQKGSIYDYIHSLHPRIEVTDTKVNFHKYKLFEVYKNETQEVILTIDSYHIPHLLIGLYDHCSTIKLIIPAYITAYDRHKLPEDTLNILKGVADDTRMKIIKYLYGQSMSTQKLADSLNLTEACISKHLKILFAAGIVSKVRDGNYMQYHLNINVIDSLVLNIYEYMND